MGQINVSLPSDGSTGTVSQYNTPINTIVNEFNTGIDNSNIKAAAAIDGSKLADASIPATKLATGAITLGYAQITADFTTAASNAAVTGLSTTVTIPAGGRRVKITAWVECIQHSAAITNLSLSIWDGTVGSGTQLARSFGTIPGSNYSLPATCIAITTPAAGSKTYNVGFGSGSATSKIIASATSPAFILVEAI